ncbi:30S ribosomal protein S9 [Thermus thermophilus]|uniref:Small ribosomal subunit protein uS9 n=6 Tax=Bacteria TaxID=2 RepID=RS9_THET2|nr:MULTISPECIES: 30S ribosomal protein S9 [Thermus]P62669.1 RecName: Full=Small ribosomal subunit protein uS9; AltName: Full=30S ribosomal protein S9 [Thermus thermophilus HB27]1FJG_I Chain I, 30s Ribosomal Protein S9 [Thermus thermophilus]1HNW_I Chain I, 30S RIBOSOMAL PROTEIN S9 [Thermus thermophilus]1HNX_I Chain I, 30S RIBOSOMAL PROTEIN S9 [Thermus thermophilus]1HNZ_I Chain I, 30S RIBOSOMAL PROTEIN S9 [Thermus thermophilus]1HR0_I Chain I, 30S RIBOSOMAL PROTEIN S9 [Thermus thermophilus]1I94
MEQYYGTGRRKEAVARVFLRPGNGKVTVNGQDFNEYFQGLVRAVAALEPLRAVDALGRFDAYITVRGGGKSGQIDAIKLGIARALVQYNPDYRAKLKPLGFLTRDARVVERKKYGKHKARRAPQYSKR